jgi:hypothetical protein
MRQIARGATLHPLFSSAVLLAILAGLGAHFQHSVFSSLYFIISYVLSVVGMRCLSRHEDEQEARHEA